MLALKFLISVSIKLSVPVRNNLPRLKSPHQVTIRGRLFMFNATVKPSVPVQYVFVSPKVSHRIAVQRASGAGAKIIYFLVKTSSLAKAVVILGKFCIMDGQEMI